MIDIILFIVALVVGAVLVEIGKVEGNTKFFGYGLITLFVNFAITFTYIFSMNECGIDVTLWAVIGGVGMSVLAVFLLLVMMDV